MTRQMCLGTCSHVPTFCAPLDIGPHKTNSSSDVSLLSHLGTFTNHSKLYNLISIIIILSKLMYFVKQSFNSITCLWHSVRSDRIWYSQKSVFRALSYALQRLTKIIYICFISVNEKKKCKTLDFFHHFPEKGACMNLATSVNAPLGEVRL